MSEAGMLLTACGIGFLTGLIVGGFIGAQIVWWNIQKYIVWKAEQLAEEGR